MTLVSVFGGYLPQIPHWIEENASLAATGPIDATGEKIAIIGNVLRSGNISRVQFLFGAVTKAGGSGLTVSLQDYNLTSGAPNRPDETQDQTVAIANGDSSFASNTWYRTSTLSSSRAVSVGDRLAVVFEYDGSGRLGSDSVVIAATTAPSGLSQHGGTRLKTGGTWGSTAGIPILLVEYDDGAVAPLSTSIAISAIGTLTAHHSGTTPDEYALKLVPLVNCKVNGFWAWASGDGESSVVLYDSASSTLASATLDNPGDWRDTSMRHLVGALAETTLTAGQTYRLALKPTSTTTVALRYADVNDATHLSSWGMGAGCCISSRTDGGSWSDTTTRIPMMGLRISALDDGLGVGLARSMFLGGGGIVL